MKDKIKLEAELIEVKENIKNTYARVYKDRYAPHRNREDMIELKKLLRRKENIQINLNQLNMKEMNK